MKITVLGDGGWGTALSILLDGNGHETMLWSVDPDYARILRERRSNPKFLPGVRIPKTVRITSSPSEAMEFGELIFSAVPVQYMRAVLKQCRRSHRGAPIVNAAKGLEIGTLLRGSEVVRDVLGEVPVGAISGPSHAEEVARRLPTTVVAASQVRGLPETVQRALNNDRFRVYTSSDIMGVELGGAIKNVIAIAAGISDGLGFGDNTKAALLTRGTVELARLGAALGARPETFWGLSGIGDLITTGPTGTNVMDIHLLLVG